METEHGGAGSPLDASLTEEGILEQATEHVIGGVQHVSPPGSERQAGSLLPHTDRPQLQVH